jgi:hypothetical protein
MDGHAQRHLGHDGFDEGDLFDQSVDELGLVASIDDQHRVAEEGPGHGSPCRCSG